MVNTKHPLERFEDAYATEPNSGCWLWLKSLDKDGYGWFYLNKNMKAHVASWELFKGSRNGLWVLHNCDVRRCVNPEHLYLGTNDDNVRDRMERGKFEILRGSKIGNSKLIESEVRAIRKDSREQKYIAADYGISVASVSLIQARKNWKHVK